MKKSKIVASLSRNGITWHLRKKFCPDKRKNAKGEIIGLCNVCKNAIKKGYDPPHGPYLEAYFKNGGKTGWDYIKKSKIPGFDSKNLKEMVDYLEGTVQLKLTDLIYHPKST